MYDKTGPSYSLGQQADRNYAGNAPECAVRKQSDCEAAYQQLLSSQELLAESICILQNRLAPVANEAMTGSACADPTQAPQSEVHGWLIAAEERATAARRRIQAITSALTI